MASSNGSKSVNMSASQTKQVNEYIPAFIAKKPFYIDGDDTASDYLEHQRLQKAATDQSKWYDRGKRVGPAATKFRKGACENCGAMTHKAKECLNRPRAKGAKWTGKDIQADEIVQDVQLGWDAKRDRWNGYDATEYRTVVQEFEELEDLKRKIKVKDNDSKPSEDAEEEHDADNEEARYAEESDMGRQQSTATRNLRIREDTAKYLLNLDLDSAKYDPKTRSMVDMGAQADSAAALVAEDNFMRASGDAAEFEKAQKYARESQERGDRTKIHVQANPTSGEYHRRREKEEKDAKKEAQQKKLLEKYGGEQHLKKAPIRDTAVIENERYVEYDESGAIKGASKAAAKSKYAEDIYLNNHTSVWGSWWKSFQWGYACCHSTVKNSYCTGDEGKKAFEEAYQVRTAIVAEEKTPARVITEHGKEDPEKSEEREADGEDRAAPITRKTHLKKRTLAEMKGGVSEEELDAYKRSRAVENDPMANFLGKDELVH